MISIINNIGTNIAMNVFVSDFKLNEEEAFMQVVNWKSN
jgi:hypothetical protein